MMTTDSFTLSEEHKGVDLSSDPRWQLAQRIAASKSLGRSQLLASFLLYVTDRTLNGCEHEVTEQQIGVHVFNRREGYNSNEDNIVRNYARNLRKRIAEYFLLEGREESLHLEIPRGGYIPIFTPLGDAAPLEPSPDPLEKQVHLQVKKSEPPPPTILVEKYPKPRRFLWLCAMIALVLAGWMATRSIKSHANGGVRTKLWGRMFSHGRNTYIVSADSGLGLMEALSKRSVSLGDYVSGKYMNDSSLQDSPYPAHLLQEIASRRYTGVADLEISSRLKNMPEAQTSQIFTRFARDFCMDDLRSGNAILLGSPESNPWVELFQQQMNFEFAFDPKTNSTPLIVNKHPLQGEAKSYATHFENQRHMSYGVIAYLPSLDPSGHVLLISGINMAGTQGAANFLLNDALMAQTIKRATNKKGELQSFELLIETTNIAANSERPLLISERIHSE